MTGTNPPGEKILIGISACLLGEKVRFDGQHQLQPYIEQTLGRYFEFRAFCPEVSIGLGIPRKPIRLIRIRAEDDAGPAQVRCVGTTAEAVDYTQQLADCAQEQFPWIAEVSGYILKKSSPSCGMERVKVYERHVATRDGTGIFASTVMQRFPDLPVEEEGRLGDSVLRENFIQRVYVMHRWQKLLSEGLSSGALVDFHARHKLVLMSHCQKTYRELGPFVAGITRGNVAEKAPEYFSRLMQALRKPATRGNHVNVLQHIQGYLKNGLDADDRAELTESIQAYLRGQLPLIVPITLLNHHFRRHPDPYISRSWYMNAYPAELSLQNNI